MLLSEVNQEVESDGIKMSHASSDHEGETKEDYYDEDEMQTRKMNEISLK